MDKKKTVRLASQDSMERAFGEELANAKPSTQPAGAPSGFATFSPSGFATF